MDLTVLKVEKEELFNNWEVYLNAYYIMGTI